jgi:hypothetical protein
VPGICFPPPTWNNGGPTPFKAGHTPPQHTPVASAMTYTSFSFFSAAYLLLYNSHDVKCTYITLNLNTL